MAGYLRKRIDRERGSRSEQFALDHLLAKGLELHTRNFRCRLGEIDLVMRDDNCLVFVEVRYRTANRFAGAVLSVDTRKQAKIARTAGFFLGKHPGFADHPVRFDVVAFDGSPGDEYDKGTLQWIKDAFRV